MPLNPKEFEKVFANHFETINPEQFIDNLKAACPYLFDEDSILIVNTINNKENCVKLLSVASALSIEHDW